MIKARSRRIDSVWVRLSVLLLLSSGGCPEEQLKPDQVPQFPRNETNAEAVARLRTQLALVASKSICSSEVRALIRLVEHECGVRECPSDDLRALTRQIEPHQRFMWLMRDVPHAVVYLRDGFAARSPRESMLDERYTRLYDLLKPPWLDFSKVWIVAHSSTRETNRDMVALERADKVKQAIEQMRFGPDQARIASVRILTVSYDFPLREPTVKQQNPVPGKNEYLTNLELLDKNIMLKADMPISGEPSDSAKGVWVFLLDCTGGA